MSTSGSSAWNSHLTQGGRTTSMTMPVNRITSQSKIKLSQKYCPWINLQLWNFCHSFPQWMGIFSWLLCFALQYMFIQIGSQTWASSSFDPPGWGANSSQSRCSCSFSGHKQTCSTVLSELRYKVAYNPSLLRRGLFVLWGGFCVVGRLGRKKKRARGARWEGGREKRGAPRAFYFCRLLIFWWGYPAGASAEEREHSV